MRDTKNISEEFVCKKNRASFYHCFLLLCSLNLLNVGSVYFAAKLPAATGLAETK